jgi:peptidyl-Lys metalloendopeptidase
MFSKRTIFTIGTLSLVTAIGVSSAIAIRNKPVANPLMIGMSTESTLGSGFTGRVNFKLTNNSRDDVRIARWQTPVGGIEQDIFDVTVDGKPVEYIGKQIKRSGIYADELMTLRAGESKVTNFDLSQAYDMSKPGNYSVRFKSYLQGASTTDGRRIQASNGGLAVAQSVTLKAFKDVSTPSLLPAEKSMSENNLIKPAATTGFVGCTTSRQSQINTAIANAKTYASNSASYLNAGTTGARYTTWFGAYTSSRYSTVRSHFSSISSAFNNQNITVNCKCSKSAYAYVYPTQPYTIYVCKAFWTAPATGTDSKAGTMVHEMSHFDIVANTDDVVYGQAGAKNLANTNPNDAVRNADSHEYFAENTPFQN